ncbi:MAG: flagellar biosynthesis protein FlhF, partial [Ramlibacter sp.]|nr:flagellar biosynthesis protein FlhF [Ramlibacter sp.]
RSPLQTQVLRLLVGNGFSTQVASQLVERVPSDFSDTQAEKWLAEVLTHNLRCPEEDAIQRHGGVFALVGPTGVGKTTTTAKLAANFALEHGAASVGLITVDTYRMAASDQLRAYGGILNIPVHTARDNASLVDLLDLFARKKLVLIDTVGVGQRDRRLSELFAALPANRIERLLVLNASAQAETLDEVVQAYSAGPGTRCAFTKLDEAVKCGAIIDVALRHQLRVEGFANGQRVPEDWHASRAHVLVQKALMKPAHNRYTPDDAQLAMMFATSGMRTPGSTSLGGGRNHA